jgi:GntR family transcriptional regulator
MLHLQIDPHSGMPVYRQVMEQIKYYVASGGLKSGDLLPSIRDLARTLAVNPTTVVKAYTELEHEGVIEMKHGKGAFVSSLSTKLTQAQQRRALQRLARQLAVGRRADIQRNPTGCRATDGRRAGKRIPAQS